MPFFFHIEIKITFEFPLRASKSLVEKSTYTKPDNLILISVHMVEDEN